MGYVWTMQGCVCTECYLYGDPKISYVYLWDSLDQGYVLRDTKGNPKMSFLSMEQFGPGIYVHYVLRDTKGNSKISYVSVGHFGPGMCMH